MKAHTSTSRALPALSVGCLEMRPAPVAPPCRPCPDGPWPQTRARMPPAPRAKGALARQRLGKLRSQPGLSDGCKAKRELGADTANTGRRRAGGEHPRRGRGARPRERKKEATAGRSRFQVETAAVGTPAFLLTSCARMEIQRLAGAAARESAPLRTCPGAAGPYSGARTGAWAMPRAAGSPCVPPLPRAPQILSLPSPLPPARPVPGLGQLQAAKLAVPTLPQRRAVAARAAAPVGDGQRVIAAGPG